MSKMEYKNKVITYRDIAKMLASALPIQGEEFGQKVETYIAEIRSLSAEAKTALKSAYLFSHKVPREEKQDFFQDIALAVLKANTKSEKLGYAIARCDWVDFWKKYAKRNHYSLDSVMDDIDGNPVTLSEMLVGETEFERKMDGKIEAERIFEMLPDDIKPLIDKRLIGKALNNKERAKLSYYVKTQGYKLILNTN